LLILDSNHYARDPGGAAKQIDEVVSGAGGKVLVNRLWMEQKLAYPIDKHQKGTYWLTYFESEGENITKMDRAFHLHETVIRHLTIKLDPRLVEPVLANARGESVTQPVGETESSSEEKPTADVEGEKEAAVEA
jgi:small subunit ribosomal protein S6